MKIKELDKIMSAAVDNGKSVQESMQIMYDYQASEGIRGKELLNAHKYEVCIFYSSSRIASTVLNRIGNEMLVCFIKKGAKWYNDDVIAYHCGNNTLELYSDVIDVDGLTSLANSFGYKGEVA